MIKHICFGYLLGLLMLLPAIGSAYINKQLKERHLRVLGLLATFAIDILYLS